MASHVCRSLPVQLRAAGRWGAVRGLGLNFSLQPSPSGRTAVAAVSSQTQLLEGHKRSQRRSFWGHGQSRQRHRHLARTPTNIFGINSSFVSNATTSPPKNCRALSNSSYRTPNSSPTYSVAKISSAGTVSMTSLRIPEILRGSSLHARDLFSLALTSGHDVACKRPRGALSRTPSAILPRGKEVVVSFGSVRALIGKDSGMIFDAHKPSIQLLAAELASTFETKMSEAARGAEAGRHNLYITEDYSVKMRYVGEPFELVFIEEILRDTCDTFNRRLRVYEPIVDSLLNRVNNEVFSATGVQHLVPIKDSLQEFEMNVKTCLECLTHLLENDEDMLALLLTEQHEAKRSGVDIKPTLHVTVELLFEEYARQLNNIIHEIHFLLKRVQSKQELVAISLDAYRNRMIRMNVLIAVVGMGLATATTVAGFYGMNLVNGHEESPTAFNTVVLLTTMAGFSIFLACSSYLSGANMAKRAAERMEEIETITGALSDMQALDYAIKTMVDNKRPMNKDDFTQKLMECRQTEASEKEIDMLFQVLDISSDGYIYTEDFRSIENFGGHQSPQHIRIDLPRKQRDEGRDKGGKST